MHGLADLAAALGGTPRAGDFNLNAAQHRTMRERLRTETPPAALSPNAEYGLTTSERAVLELAAKGMQNAQIARQRGVSVGTIKAQMHRIFEKLGTRSRFEASLLYRVVLSAEPAGQAQADDGDFDFAWLNQVALSAQRMPAGKVLFQQGDVADRLYFIIQGNVRLLERAGPVYGPRSLLGEIGGFAPGHRHSWTAVCATEVNVLSMDREQMRRCYRVYPQFAIYIQYSLIRKLLADRQEVAGAAMS